MKISPAILIFSLVSVFAYGYQPFVTNYKSHQDFFYPIDEFDYSENRPSNFKDSDRFTLFFKSIFFKVNGEFAPPKDRAEYKWPFTSTREEWNSFTYLGPKSGGFGMYFSGLFLLALLLQCFSFPKRNYRYYNYSLFVLVGSSIINPLNNVARYIPQLWFVLPVAMLTSFTVSNNRKIFILNFVLVVFVALNSVLIFKSALVSNLENTKNIETQLSNLRSLSMREPILINFGQSEGNKLLLNYYGVRYSSYKKKNNNFSCPKNYKKTPLFSLVGTSVAVACIK